MVLEVSVLRPLIPEVPSLCAGGFFCFVFKNKNNVTLDVSLSQVMHWKLHMSPNSSGFLYAVILILKSAPAPNSAREIVMQSMVEEHQDLFCFSHEDRPQN